MCIVIDRFEQSVTKNYVKHVAGWKSEQIFANQELECEPVANLIEKTDSVNFCSGKWGLSG